MSTIVGTKPVGTSGEQQAAQWVQKMFAGIAPRYDLINHVLSFTIDRSWRKKLMNGMSEVLARPEAVVLDLCCGTGDVLLDLKRYSQARIVGADFCHPMLTAAQEKAASRGFKASLFEADALQLPLADDALEGIAISFGFRNLTNYEGGLRELARVLKPGGVLAILEFSHPPGAFMKTAYGFYSKAVLPVVGTLISGSREAYNYLPDSIRKFPTADALKTMMEAAGFTSARYELLTGGIAALHLAQKQLVANAL